MNTTRRFEYSSYVLPLCAVIGVSACAGTVERATRNDLAEIDARLAPIDRERGTEQTPTAVQLDGSLSGYLAYAFEHSPALRASFEDWRAATHRPRQARRLPEPTITYAGFIRAVETRVGPQRHKLGVVQWFPWPTKLTAGGKAEAIAARSAQREFEAHALEVAADVSRAYWRLWLVERSREVQRDQRVLLRNLSEQIRVRVEASMTDLAALSQINLAVTRIEDRIAGLDEAERAASAELVRVIGAPDATPTPIGPDAPDVELPRERDETLRAHARAHPRVEAIALMSDASRERIRKARADRFPSFGVGVDWIITGAAVDPSMPGSGKDPVIAMAAIRLPIWGRAYGAAEREAKARSAAYRARTVAAEQRAIAEVERTLADLRDDARRVDLYRTTLVPQAETNFAAVQVSYQAGRATVADVLLAERDLLELELGLRQAQAELAVGWAELERVVGRPLESKGGDR